jgi:hypothetical protein
MIIIKNRSSYVEVIEGTSTIFCKNKPSNKGGITSRLLAALGIVGTGVYHLSFHKENATCYFVRLNELDARFVHQAEEADNIVFNLQVADKEVIKIL